MLLGREATFYYRGKRIRFTVPEDPPERMAYSHRECAAGQPERLELELLEVDRAANTALYRVRAAKTS